MADNQDSTENDEKQAEFDSKINAVVKSHLRRETKALAEQISALRSLITESAAKTSETKPEDGKGRSADGKVSEKSDPQVKQLMDAQARIERELKEERDRRVALEKKAKRESILLTMREPLEAAGIKGTRLSALLHYLEAKNLQEVEGADPSFKVARSRGKGAPVEEMEFDISSGIQDWLKSPEAADFLPAPTVNAQRNTTAPRNGSPQKQPAYDKPARSVDEMLRRTAEQLAARGVDINEALKGD